MSDLFDPAHAAELTAFYTNRVSALRAQKNGLHALQLKETYLSHACDPQQAFGCHWIVHPIPDIGDVPLFWVQLFRVQKVQGKARLSALQTEHHILTAAETEALQAHSNPTRLVIEHSGTLLASLITNWCPDDSLPSVINQLSVLESKVRVGEWHVLWPLHEIALCRDDGQATVFLPSPVQWASFCRWVSHLCELDSSASTQFTRFATAEYISALRYVHSSNFLSRTWMQSLKSLLKNNSISLTGVSESLGNFDAYAEGLLVEEERKPVTERLGWDVFSSLNQNGSLLCTIPNWTAPEDVQVVELQSKTTEPRFLALPELRSADGAACLLSHVEALTLERAKFKDPKKLNAPLSDDVLKGIAESISLVSGQPTLPVEHGLYFDKNRLTQLLDLEFNDTVKFFA